MARVTVTEHSRRPDIEQRTGKYDPTVIGSDRLTVHRRKDSNGEPNVTVDSAKLSQAAHIRRAHAELDEYLQELRIAALKPDAAVGAARRVKSQTAGKRSGAARRAKNLPLISEVQRLRLKNPSVRNSEIARVLFNKFGRSQGDRVKAIRALAKRIGRLKTS